MAPPAAGVRRDSTHLAFGAGPGAGADMDVSNDSPGQESVTAADSNGDKTEHAPKRIRLNLACNQCRKRKVRCDAETPKVSPISSETCPFISSPGVVMLSSGLSRRPKCLDSVARLPSMF